MTSDEIRDTWEDFYGNDAFDIFDHNRTDNATIGEVLGQDVASEYSSWIYNNLK
jgi:hypothetical protein